MSDKLRVLAVGAHPHDLEFQIGGTLAKYAEQGHKVFMAVTTNGDVGSATLSRAEIARIRYNEAKSSAELIGAELIWVGYNDEFFFDNEGSRRRFIDIIRLAEPCFLLTQHLAHIDFLDEQIEAFSQEIKGHLEQGPVITLPAASAIAHTEPSGIEPASIEREGAEVTAPQPVSLSWQEAIGLLDTITGVDQRVAELIIAEIGIDMRQFPSAAHLACWTGVAPGNKKSAGKQLPGRIGNGDRPIRKILIQAAHAAVKSKGYLASLYQRVAARRGKRRAIIAVAHSIVISIYYILSRKEEWHEASYGQLDERRKGTTTKRLVRQLERLGYQVNLTASLAEVSRATRQWAVGGIA